jgi:hypothetical protein
MPPVGMGATIMRGMCAGSADGSAMTAVGMTGCATPAPPTIMANPQAIAFIGRTHPLLFNSTWSVEQEAQDQTHPAYGPPQ